MPLDEPHWWYGSDGKGDLAARLLSPIGLLYGFLAEQRYRRHAPYRARVPVICVGNFTAGGTGKTPLSLLIAEHVQSRGSSPVFLTRGYAGRITAPAWVDRAAHSGRDVGDEALLLARMAPTMIARDRRAGALMIEDEGPPACVIVMDDGLQNPSLKKDLAIAVVDGARGIGNGEVIPAGPLRAPLEFQLGLVDCIVVNEAREDRGAGQNAVLDRLRRRFPGPVLAARVEPLGDAGWLQGAPVVAYAGIAHPERFFGLLERLGARLELRAAFADHHAFAEADAERLVRAARACGGVLVTTEKDLARLQGSSGRRGELSASSRALPIRLVLDDRDLGRLVALINAAIKTGGGGRGVPQR